MEDINIKLLDGKSFDQLIDFATKLARTSLENKLHAHKVFTLILDQIPRDYQYSNRSIRGFLNQALWDLERYFHWNQRYLSQSGQDRAVFHRIWHRNASNGFFLDIGAYDGLNGSNTFFFERFLGWKGIAVEGSRTWYEELKKNRKCECIHAVVSSCSSRVDFVEVSSGLTQMSGIKSELYKKFTMPILADNSTTSTNNYKVDTTTLSEILGNRQNIDFLSIDVEGAEMDILESIDFNKIKIGVVSVENNLPEILNFNKFFHNFNFEYLDRYGSDEIFFNRNLFNRQQKVLG